jgi:head-tail adaptor
MAGPLGARSHSHAGRLRNRVKVERDTGTTRAESGEVEAVWTTLIARVFCEVVAATGRELFASSHVQAQVSHRVTMRRDTTAATITESDRLVWLDGANATLNIVAVLPSVGGSNFLDVWCLQEK